MRIAVFCGSSRHAEPRFTQPARALGAEIARRGHTLVYGGGRTGLMGCLADAALETGGRVEGVILDRFVEQGVHHPGVDVMHTVTNMRARKAGLDERADAFVALPGGYGTLEELTEILSLRKIGLHQRRLVLFDMDGFFSGLIAQIERGIATGFDAAEVRDYFVVTDEIAAAVDLCEASLTD